MVQNYAQELENFPEVLCMKDLNAQDSFDYMTRLLPMNVSETLMRSPTL